MKFGEYLDVINLELRLLRYPNQNNRYCASIEGAEVMERSMLISKHGNGPSPKEAINDYLSLIRGRRICIGAYRDNRREYDVPQSIEDEQ